MNEHMEELLSQYLDEELDDETTAYVRGTRSDRSSTRARSERGSTVSASTSS